MKRSYAKSKRKIEFKKRHTKGLYSTELGSFILFVRKNKGKRHKADNCVVKRDAGDNCWVAFVHTKMAHRGSVQKILSNYQKTFTPALETEHH